MLADLRNPDARQLEALALHTKSLASGSVKSNILDWSEANVIFPHSDRCPNFSRDFAPWWNKPLKDFATGDWNVISFVGPTGGGKTSFLEALTTYVIAQDPGPMLIIGQTDKDIADWAEERLMPMLDEISATKALMPSKVYAKRKTEIMFPHMPMRLGGANLNNLQSKSCRYVFLDEVWTFAPGMVKEAQARLHDRANGVMLVMGQGGIENDEHDTIHNTTYKLDYHWRCPTCMEYNLYSSGPEQLLFDEVRTESGELDRMALARSVRVMCPKCQHTFNDNEPTRKLLSMAGDYLPVESNPWPRRIGYHMHAMGVWWIPWASIAADRVEAVERMQIGDYIAMKAFTQKKEGKFWSAEFEVPRIQLQPGGYGKGEFENGELIEGEYIRFLTVDKQLDHLWFVIRAWTADGGSKLLNEGRVNSYGEITDLQEKYKVVPTAVVIDCRYMPGDVYAFCAAHGYTAIRGDRVNSWPHVEKDRPTVRKPYSPMQIVQASDGNKCASFSYSNLHIKDVLSLLRMGRLKPFEVANDTSNDYEKHMSTEVRRNVASEHGEPTMRWLNINKRPNHLFDCECIGVAMAIMFDIIRLDESFQVIME